MTPSPSARRGAAALLALGLASGALAAGAGSAHADAVTDVTGLVVGTNGAPVANIEVVATTPGATGGPAVQADSAVTDAGGRFALTDLDAASLPANAAGATTFKLSFTDDTAYPPSAYRTALPYLATFLGGADTYRRSAPVTVTPGATVTVATTPVVQSSGILATVTGPTGAPVQGAQVVTLDADADLTGDGLSPSSSTDDDLDASAAKDGVVVVKGLKAADGPVRVYGSGSDTTPAFRSYLGRYFGGTGSLASATPVTLRPGTFTTLSIQLTDALSPTVAPRITGDSSFGSKLRAEPGTWTRTAGTTYTYQWLRGSTVVSTAPVYRLSKAYKGARIGLRVTAANDDFGGVATARPSAEVGEKSKVTVTSRKNGTYAVRVTVAKKKLAARLGTPRGRVVLLTDDGTRASKRVALVGGRALLRPIRSAQGTLTVVYLGGGKLGSDAYRIGGRTR